MDSTIDTVIESLVEVHCQAEADQRQRHLLRESLRGLVRLAQAEQMWEIKANVRALTSMSQAKIKRQANRLLKSTSDVKAAKDPCQGKLALDTGSTCVGNTSKVDEAP